MPSAAQPNMSSAVEVTTVVNTEGSVCLDETVYKLPARKVSISICYRLTKSMNEKQTIYVNSEHMIILFSSCMCFPQR